MLTKPSAARGTSFCSLCSFSPCVPIPCAPGPPQQPNYPLISGGAGSVIVLPCSAQLSWPAEQSHPAAGAPKSLNSLFRPLYFPFFSIPFTVPALVAAVTCRHLKAGWFCLMLRCSQVPPVGIKAPHEWPGRYFPAVWGDFSCSQADK